MTYNNCSGQYWNLEVYNVKAAQCDTSTTFVKDSVNTTNFLPELEVAAPWSPSELSYRLYRDID